MKAYHEWVLEGNVQKKMAACLLAPVSAIFSLQTAAVPCARGTCSEAAWAPANSSTQSSRDLAAWLLHGLECCLSDRSSFNKAIVYWVCPPPQALDVFSHSPYESLLLKFSSLWQINTDRLGAESLNVVCLGFVEFLICCLTFSHQLWDIFALISLTCALYRSSLLGIPRCVLGGDPRASEGHFSLLCIIFILGSAQPDGLCWFHSSSILYFLRLISLSSVRARVLCVFTWTCVPTQAKRRHQVLRSWCHRYFWAILFRCWGLLLGPVQEQYALLTSETLLQPLTNTLHTALITVCLLFPLLCLENIVLKKHVPQRVTHPTECALFPPASRSPLTEHSTRCYPK